MSWRLSNGYERLARQIGGMPDFDPYNFAVEVVQGVLDVGFVQPLGIFAEGSSTLSSDAEFWAVALTLGINEDPERQGFGDGDWENSPTNVRTTIILGEESGGQRLSDKWIHAGCVFGASHRTGYLPVPWILRPGATLQVRQHSYFGGGLISNDHLFYYMLHGFKVPLRSAPPPLEHLILDPRLVAVLEDYRRRGRLGRVEPFWYALNFAPDPGNPQAGVALTTEERSFTVSEPADFLMLDFALSQHIDTESSGDYSYAASPRGMLRLHVDHGDVRLDDRPIDLRAFGGAGAKRPHRFPAPLILKPGQTFSAVLTQTERGAAPPLTPRRDTYLAFGGVRIFPPGVEAIP